MRGRKQERGLTIAELMIVVAIIGVISSLAGAGVMSYMAHAKTAEATTTLAAFENGSRGAFNIEIDESGDGRRFVHRFCATAAARVPVTVPAAARVKADWSGETWKCLRFTATGPQFYQYDYSSSGTDTAAIYVAAAYGDLDGDGQLARYILKGAGGGNGEATRVSFTVIDENE